MRTKIAALSIFLIFLLPSFVQGVIIKGSVYDLSLERAENVIVEISEPKQQTVSKTGDYNFTVGLGSYTLEAKKIKNGIVVANASEKINVMGEGEFILDLVLFPVLDEIEIEDINIDNLVEPQDNTLVFLGFAVIIIALGILFWKIKKKKPEIVKEVVKEIRTEHLPKDLEQVLNIVKNKGGRANQKDIRRETSLSEAKVSLMIADLESRKIVKKIKKGRGNIIILEK